VLIPFSIWGDLIEGILIMDMSCGDVGVKQACQIDQSIVAFVDSVEHYFTTISNRSVSIGTPFLVEDDDIYEYISDYTGVIGISGDYRGVVRFTAPHVLLTHLMSSLGVLTAQEDKLMDLVGEVSNTISGNARLVFGEKFMLSVPTVFKGKNNHIDQEDEAKEQRCVVIPIVWYQKKAHLITNIY